MAVYEFMYMTLRLIYLAILPTEISGIRFCVQVKLHSQN